MGEPSWVGGFCVGSEEKLEENKEDDIEEFIVTGSKLAEGVTGCAARVTAMNMWATSHKENTIVLTIMKIEAQGVERFLPE